MTRVEGRKKKLLHDRICRGALGVNNIIVCGHKDGAVVKGNDNHLAGGVWSCDFQQDTFHLLVPAGANGRRKRS